MPTWRRSPLLADDDPMSGAITLSTIPRPVSIPPGPTLHGDPCTLVIFGAAGDLARRKLMPAVYYLAKKHLLAHDFRIVGVGIESHDDDSFRAAMREALESEGE